MISAPEAMVSISARARGSFILVRIRSIMTPFLYRLERRDAGFVTDRLHGIDQLFRAGLFRIMLDFDLAGIEVHFRIHNTGNAFQRLLDLGDT